MNPDHYRTLIFTIRSDSQKLNDEATLMAGLRTLVRIGDFTELETASHTFKPTGLTMVVLLSESHIALHTWPDRGVAKLVIATCKEVPVPASDFVSSITRIFSASSVQYAELL